LAMKETAAMRKLSLYVYLHLYRSMHIYLYLYLYLYVYLSIDLSTYLSIYLYLYLLSIYLSIHLSIYTYLNEHIRIHTHICTCLYIYILIRYEPDVRHFGFRLAVERADLAMKETAAMRARTCRFPLRRKTQQLV